MSRTRSKPAVSVPGIGSRTITLLGPNGWTRKTPFNFVASSKTETMVDEVIPDFHARCERGEFFMNPMSKTIIRTHAVPTVGSSYTPGYRADIVIDLASTGTPCAPPNDRSAIISNLITQASTKCMARVSSESINILATLGELKETKELLVSTCVALRHLLKFVEFYTWTLKEILRKRGKKAFLGELYKRAENAWMQCRMGYRPFAYEAMSLFEACSDLREGPPKRQTFRAKAKADITAVNKAPWSHLQVPATIYGERTYDEKYIVRATTVCEQRYAGFPDTFGVWKIPQAIWELTKLSWAVDYFLNVGDAIAAFTPDTLWNPKGSCYVERSTIQQVNQVDRVAMQSYVPFFTGGYSAKITESVKRTSGTSLGVVFRPKMNWAKYLDMMAVTRQKAVPIIRECLKTRQRVRKKR